MNWKEDILNIIHGSPDVEPIVLLASKFNQLSDKKDKKDFIDILKDLALNGNKIETYISINTIDFIGGANECKDDIRKVIDKIELKKDEKLIRTLLSLCSTLSLYWSIDFIKRIIKYYRPPKNQYSYYYDIALRSIISTLYWRDQIPDIKFMLKEYEGNDFIDFVAYFIWCQGKDELETLLTLVDDASIRNKIIN